MVALADRYTYRPDLTRRLERLNELAGEPARRQESARPSDPRRLSFRLSDTMRQELVDDYLNGTPTTTLTTRYSLGKGTVLEVLAEAGVSMRRQPLSGDQVQEAARLYECGYSLARVAKELDSAPTTVGRAIRGAGVTLRPRPGRSSSIPANQF